MAWTIAYTPKAQRQLKRLDRPVADRIDRFFTERVAVAESPYSLATQLTDGTGRWRFRVGDYRVICDLRYERLVVSVVKVAHRKDVYD